MGRFFRECSKFLGNNFSITELCHLPGDLYFANNVTPSAERAESSNGKDGSGRLTILRFTYVFFPVSDYYFRMIFDLKFELFFYYLILLCPYIFSVNAKWENSYLFWSLNQERQRRNKRIRRCSLCSTFEAENSSLLK